MIIFVFHLQRPHQRRNPREKAKELSSTREEAKELRWWSYLIFTCRGLHRWWSYWFAFLYWLWKLRPMMMLSVKQTNWYTMMMLSGFNIIKLHPSLKICIILLVNHMNILYHACNAAYIWNSFSNVCFTAEYVNYRYLWRNESNDFERSNAWCFEESDQNKMCKLME
jgi:hypothetical protein